MKIKAFVSAIICLSLLVGAVLPLGITASAEAEVNADERLGVGEGAAALNNKKILFTGCSYTYYGGIVEQTGSTIYSQSTRTSGETGFFKRLLGQHGVSGAKVTDWVFGGHDLTDIFDGYCNAGSHDGHDHLADLTDRNYDIVVLHDIITTGYTAADQYVNNIKTVMDVFLEENPNTEFYLMLHNQVYLQSNYAPIRNSIQPAVERLGVRVIDWGALVYDILKGNVTVPGATETYNKQSFIVSNNASDGYHPSLLAGYIGTIMVYATLTGETTVGQPYEWIYPLTSKYLNIDKFIANHYKYDDPATTDVDESKTNMKEIFYSAPDMLGLQTLAEQYLTKTRWLDFAEYTVEFRNEAGEAISSGKYKWGAEIDIPEAPEKAGDNAYKYVFSGWDKAVVPCAGDAVYTATYTKEAKEYTVKFLDSDGSVIKESTLRYGDAVTAPIPDGFEDEEYRYVFSGWDKTVANTCLGDAQYTARYTQMKKGFVISFRDWDGTLISADTYKAGDAVNSPDAPTRAADNTYTYAFSGWDKAVVPCAGDATYTATYTETYIDYTVKFLDGEGNLIEERTYHFGDAVTPPAIPEKPADNVYTYASSGWDKAVVPCVGDATYTASYTRTYVIYNVVFFDETGEVIQSMTRRWGERVTIPTPPPKIPDAEYTYVFAGWDKTVAIECAGDASYTAVYDRIPIVSEPDSPDTPDTPETPDAPDKGEESESGFFAAIRAFFERIIAWFKSLFGISQK